MATRRVTETRTMVNAHHHVIIVTIATIVGIICMWMNREGKMAVAERSATDPHPDGMIGVTIDEMIGVMTDGMIAVMTEDTTTG